MNQFFPFQKWLTHLKKWSVMLRLHYVPGGHGSHVSGHRGQNGMDVRGRDGEPWQAVIAVDAGPDF